VVCLLENGADQRLIRLAARVADPDGALAVVPLASVARADAHRIDAALADLARRDATLAVVAVHDHGRARGIVRGSVATHLLHEAPCAVLAVPEAELADAPPAVIGVGLDGSAESGAAAAAAWDLAARFGSTVRAIAATGRPRHADLELVRRIEPDFETSPETPVEALVELSGEVDLLVVGSRGLRGIRALGSVSERVAHESRCPVLVVRDHPRAKGAER
jgi:nucleotide-binding universal stress UspA family protein